MKFRANVIEGKASTALRSRLFDKGSPPLRAVSGANAHHAQIAEAAGVQAFVISGSAVSANLLGLPDVGLLTLTEIVENARRVCGAVSIPVIVDCDTGYGNALGVVRTVTEVIAAGAAGLFIEDQVSPKRCGFTEGKRVVPIGEMVGKLRAALDARDQLDTDVIIMARTDARTAVDGTFDDVMKRCQAYKEAGADSLMVVGLQDREEIAAITEAFSEMPVVALAHNLRPRLSPAEYQELNLAMEISKMTVIGSVQMYEFVKDFIERGSEVYTESVARYADHPLSDFGFLKLAGLDEAIAMEEKYLV